MRAVAGLVLTGGLLLPGCAGYWEERGRDLLDPWRVRILGAGFHASIRATHFLQAGLGMGIPGLMEGNGIGMVGRQVGLRLNPTFIAEAGLAPLAHVRTADGTARGIVLGRTSFHEHPMPESTWTFTPSPIAYRRGYDRGLFELGGSLYWILGVDFGFDPLEFADFILGFAALDIMSDDPSRLPEDHPQSRDQHEQDRRP